MNATSAALNPAALNPAAAQTAPRDPIAKWYRDATVRSAARIIVPPPASGEHIFPRSRQPIVDHPLVLARGEEAQSFILMQSAFKYMYEIGLLETRYVIDCGLNIVNNKIPHVTNAEKLDALAVVIDEGYHAHVALDFIIQMESACGVKAIEVPQTNGNLDAVDRALRILPPETHYDFQLLSVCLAEHTLTKDLLSVGREKDTTRSFTQAMTDHVADEGRHAKYFADMVKAHWPRFPEETKRAIGMMLPDYLDDYLDDDMLRAFDRKVLLAAGLSPEETDRVVGETDGRYQENARTYILKTKANLVRLLERIGVMDHEATRASFLGHSAAPQA
jgi:hypothetical protein